MMIPVSRSEAGVFQRHHYILFDAFRIEHIAAIANLSVEKGLASDMSIVVLSDIQLHARSLIGAVCHLKIPKRRVRTRRRVRVDSVGWDYEWVSVSENTHSVMQFSKS